MAEIEDTTYLKPFEPLSRRERDVLALLNQGLSDREIADHLIVALATVKWYNRQIFAKLGVENRREAVRRARALGLFDETESANTPKYNLPSQVTPFIGRSKELDDLSRWLSQSHPRLVTILAPGGMGKTRLALAAAGAALGQFANGVFFVPLAPLTSNDHLISAIADACGFTFSPDARSPKQQLLDFLRHRHTLLVFDNFEHLLDSAPLVTDILAAAPQVKALVTSRERLNLSGEVVYQLAGLHYPEQIDTDDVLHYGAVRLFIECALRANPQFAPTDLSSVARVCRTAQGMPLAIELAAAWSRTLSPAEIAAEVERSADFLRTATRDAPERLRSVRVVFEAAWARLMDDERWVFRRMSVFRGGCTREAAQAVTGADVTTLSTLVDKALLWRNAQTERYDIHELLRQYAEQELEAAGEADTTKQAHQDYFGRFSYQWCKVATYSDQLKALVMLDADADNMRLAFDRAIEQGTPDAIEPFTEIWGYYEIRGWWLEGLGLFDKAIGKLEPHDSVALGKLLTQKAFFRCGRFGMIDDYCDLTGRSVEMLRRLSAVNDLPLPLMEYARALYQSLRNWQAALPILREAHEIAEETNARWAMAGVLYWLSAAAHIEGRNDEAKDLMVQSYQAGASVNNIWSMCFSLSVLGLYAYEAGEYDDSCRYYEECLSNARLIRYPNMTVEGLVGLSVVAYQRRDWRVADVHLGEAFQLLRDHGQEADLCGILAALAEIALELDNTQEAQRRIREALAASDDTFEESRVYLLYVAAGYLTQIGDTAHAATIYSLTKQYQIVPPDRTNAIDFSEIYRAAHGVQRTLSTLLNASENEDTLTVEAALALLSTLV